MIKENKVNDIFSTQLESCNVLFSLQFLQSIVIKI